jgi:hypothetical protein
VGKTSGGKTPSKSGSAPRPTGAGSSGPAPRPPEAGGNGHAAALLPVVPLNVIPPGASQAASRTVNAVGMIALETSARVKRQRVLDIVLPQSTSARMAEAAPASVWAISSEKTTSQFEMAEAAAQAAEEMRSETLVEAAAATEAIPDELRRSSKDLFAFLRAELEREDLESDDPHALWRRAHKRMRHELFAGPPMAELLQLEERLGVKLPPSYWDFSLEWGGGLLYVREHGAMRVIPALAVKSEVQGALCGRMLRPWLPVVDLGCGDYLALDTSTENRAGENPIHWWYCGEAKKKVADSFALWLQRLVDEDGQPYWWA